MEKLLEAYERLKKVIVSYANENNLIEGKEHELPFHYTMDNLIRIAKKKNVSEEYKWLTSSDGIYARIEQETGVKRVKKKKALTLDRIKEEIENHQIDKSKIDIKNYAQTNGITVEEVMHQLGYKNYKSPERNRTILSCIKELEEWAKDKNGFLDGAFGSKVDSALRFIYKKANEMDVDGSLLITLLSEELKFHKARFYYDYREAVDRRVKAYIKNMGNGDNIQQYDPGLYEMLKHESKYSLGGSVSLTEIKKEHGLQTKDVIRSEVERVTSDGLEDLVVNGVIEKITENKQLHRKLVKKAISLGVNVRDLIKSDIVYKNSMALPRLARVGVSYDMVIGKIKSDLKKAWDDSVLLNSQIDEYQEEKEKLKIAMSLYPKEEERVIAYNMEKTMYK